MTSNDFSGGSPVRWYRHIKPLGVVLALHLLAATGLNSALSLSRDAAKARVGAGDFVLSAMIVPFDLPKPPLVTAPKPAPLLQTSPAALMDPIPETKPETMADVLVAANPQPAAAHQPAAQSPRGLRAIPPEPTVLKYAVTKGSDSARASLAWRVDSTQRYELVYEASYFGVSMIKQVSAGVLGSSGLAPTRFGDKRRGKSEQAAHFDRDKNLVTFSNNRPESKLMAGAQDRASVLIQLASLYAGEPSKFKAGQAIEVPVASVDELEVWSFEVQGLETLALPAGQMQAVHVLRRPRRAFDQTFEVWLAPSLSHLPVRIRLTDSGGVTDSQLTARE